MKDINATYLFYYEKKKDIPCCLSNGIDLLMYIIELKRDMLNRMRSGGTYLTVFRL